MGGSRLLPDGQPLSKVKPYRYESEALMLIQDLTPIDPYTDPYNWVCEVKREGKNQIPEILRFIRKNQAF